MTTQTVSGRRYFTKAWLMEQKSLIALLVLSHTWVDPSQMYEGWAM